MVDDNVLGADRGEAVAGKIANAFGKAWCVGGEQQVGTIIDDQLLDVHHRDQPGMRVDLVGRRAQGIGHHVAQLARHGAGEIKVDHHAAAPPLQRGLVGADQILGFFLKLHVGVADQPETGPCR